MSIPLGLHTAKEIMLLLQFSPAFPAFLGRREGDAAMAIDVSCYFGRFRRY